MDEPLQEIFRVKQVLGHTLRLGERTTSSLTEDTKLFGELPEFDSMAVVSLVLALEKEFGIKISNHDLSAEVFATVGTLTQFISDRMTSQD
jgi:acyl carrier protein